MDGFNETFDNISNLSSTIFSVFIVVFVVMFLMGMVSVIISIKKKEKVGAKEPTDQWIMKSDASLYESSMPTGEPAPEKTKQYCEYCGTLIEDGKSFCSACGAGVVKK